jgi:LmbE family N-acetylglucosaminyl deacetylase
MSSSLLAIFAHPDDETVCSGTLAMAVARGWRVIFACATRGEAGQISDAALATAETLGKVREQEMVAACGELGIEDVRFLGYFDSGMAGSPENELKSSFTQEKADVIIRQLVALIRAVRPNIVITFEPQGVYGHPDHIAISRYTTEAYDLAGNKATHPDLGLVWLPKRLYYAAFSIDWLNRVFERLQARQLMMSGFEAMRIHFKENSEKVTPQITHEMDVSAFLQAKIDSLSCHRTQLTPNSFFSYYVTPVMSDLMGREYFIQARPAVPVKNFFTRN